MIKLIIIIMMMMMIIKIIMGHECKRRTVWEGRRRVKRNDSKV
jgi:hypothetical protein